MHIFLVVIISFFRVKHENLTKLMRSNRDSIAFGTYQNNTKLVRSSIKI